MSLVNVNYTFAAVAAGSQLAEKQAESPEKLAQTAANAQRTRESLERAEKAASAESVRDDSAETSDRDADGRQVWQRINKKSKQEQEENREKSKDVSGQIGNTLDISG